MSRIGNVSVCALVASVGLAASVQAGPVDPVEVIFSKVVGSPTAIVPGALDPNGDPEVTTFRQFFQLFLSPDGSEWVIRASTQQATTVDNLVLRGSGTTGSMWMQENRPVPDGLPGEVIDFFGSGLGRYNDNNHFAFTLRARGGVASVFQKVIEWDGSTFTKRFQMGDLYTGLQDVPANPTGDETVGNSVGSIHILNNGVIGSQDSSVLGIHTSRRPVATYDRHGFAQTGITTVTNYNGDGIDIVAGITANAFYTTTDGSSYGYTGTVSGTAGTTNVVVINDKVVLRQTFPIPGSTALMGANVATGENLAAHGQDIYVRGLTTSPTGAFFWRNDELLAITGDPITTAAAAGGPIETWAGSFYSFGANRKGDWVLAGKTSRDEAENDVIVFNGTTVLMREGDAIDVDGNGIFDDDAFIGRANNTAAAFGANAALAIGDDGWVYALVNLVNGAGQEHAGNPSFALPLALVRVRAFVPPTDDCPGDANGDGLINAADLSVLLSNFGGPAAGPEFGDFNGDGQCDGADLSVLLSQFGNSCK